VASCGRIKSGSRTGFTARRPIRKTVQGSKLVLNEVKDLVARSILLSSGRAKRSL
jgi:hypothetical protein